MYFKALDEMGMARLFRVPVCHQGWPSYNIFCWGVE